jgi:hypothetical protein
MRSVILSLVVSVTGCAGAVVPEDHVPADQTDASDTSDVSRVDEADAAPQACPSPWVMSAGRCECIQPQTCAPHDYCCQHPTTTGVDLLVECRPYHPGPSEYDQDGWHCARF